MSKIHRIRCDRCGEEGELEKRTIKPASPNPVGTVPRIGKSSSSKIGLKFRKPDGWKRVNKEDLCPSCSEELEEFMEADSGE